MPLPATRTQINALGDRLRKAALLPGDEELLNAFLQAHDDALAGILAGLRTLELGDGTTPAPTSRVKTKRTLVEKLIRDRGRLSTIQDVAGARIVAGETLNEQDRVTEMILARFPGSEVVDRRADPRSGYRAVHVIVTHDGCRAEIQIRTRLQHLWAECYEHLADRIGRQIRYGDDPSPGPDFGPSVELVGGMMAAARIIERLEGLDHLPANRGPQAATVPTAADAVDDDGGDDEERARLEGEIDAMLLRLRDFEAWHAQLRDSVAATLTNFLAKLEKGI